MKKLLIILLLFIAIGVSGQVTCPPTVAHLYFNVPKPLVLNQKIGSVKICDPDAGQHDTLEILPGTSSNLFGLLGNDILVSNSSTINSSTAATYSITLRASDNGSPPLFTTAIVTFTITQDNVPPAVVNQVFYIKASGTNPVTFGPFLATDRNFGTTLSYAIVYGNSENFFSINQATGYITMKGTAGKTFKSSRTWNLIIAVTDTPVVSGGKTNTVKAWAKITVTK